MTRLTIDWDSEGAFAVLTRPGAPAEIVRLPDIHRVATEAMQAELAMRGRVVVRPARCQQTIFRCRTSAVSSNI